MDISKVDCMAGK